MSDDSPLSEPVPNEVRILAAGENLGALRSIHRPRTAMARLALKESRIYVYEQAVVISNGRGALGLYRWDQILVTRKGKTWLVTRADKVTFRVTKHWTDVEAIGKAMEDGAAAAAAAAGYKPKKSEKSEKPKK